MNHRWLESRSVGALGCAVLGASVVVACATSTNPGTPFDQGSTANQAADDGAPTTITSDAAPASASSSSSGSSGGSSGSAGEPTDASTNTNTHDATAVVGGDSGGLLGAGDAGSCPAPSGITSSQQTALQIVNSTRAAMGSPCATMVASLNTSATKHCQYYAANTSNQMCISNPHVEVSGCTDYVAAQFNNRESAAGYMCMPGINQSCMSSEVMAFDNNPTYALAQWIGSIYHRTPTLDPRIRDFGYGSATSCDTIDFGEGAGSTTASDVIVSYPYDGMTGVGLSFNGAQESPTPPMPPNGWPSAMPITIYMEATNITLTTDEFGVDGGASLAHQVMTPQSAMGYLANALVLYGNAPLTSKTKYRVHVAGTRSTQGFTGSSKSAQFDVSFAFTTM
jgi:uncharacterized protein YkwD